MLDALYSVTAKLSDGSEREIHVFSETPGELIKAGGECIDYDRVNLWAKQKAVDRARAVLFNHAGESDVEILRVDVLL